MKKYNIAIINKHNIDLNLLAKYDLKTDDIKNLLDNYIRIDEVEEEEIMTVVVNEIGLINNLSCIGSTKIISEDNKYVYQMCYFDKSNILNKDKEENKEDDLNITSSLLTIDKTKVYGNTVIIKSKIKEDKLCELDNLTKEDIYKIIYTKIIHKGVILRTNKETEEYTYINFPLERFNENVVKNYRWVEIPFLKFNLVMFVQTNPEPDEINKNATKLYGYGKVYGDCVLVSKSSQEEYIDLDLNLFNKFLTLSENTLEYRKLNEDEQLDGIKKNNLPQVQNRYCILEKRISEYKNKCNYCNNNINKIYRCTGCYRLKYDSDECQKKDWDKHSSECLYREKPINK